MPKQYLCINNSEQCRLFARRPNLLNKALRLPTVLIIIFFNKTSRQISEICLVLIAFVVFVLEFSDILVDGLT